MDEDEDLSAPETPVTPPRSRREGIPSPPPSNTPKAAPRSKLQTPLNSNSLQHRGNGRGFVLCLDEENDEDVAPEVRKAPPTFRSTPTRLSRTNKDSTSRVATPREARTQAHQISDSNNPPPPSTHKLAPQPTTPLSRPQTNRSVPQTPQFVRDLMLSPRSKRRALLSTPNTLQAAHTMSSLLSLPIPLFSNLSSPTHSVDEDEDRYGDEGQEVQLAEVLEYESDSSSGVLKRKSIQPTEEGSEGHRDKVFPIFYPSLTQIQRRRISYASQEPVRNEVNIPTATQSPGKRYTTVSQKGRDGLD